MMFSNGGMALSFTIKGGRFIDCPSSHLINEAVVANDKRVKVERLVALFKKILILSELKLKL